MENLMQPTPRLISGLGAAEGQTGKDETLNIGGLKYVVEGNDATVVMDDTYLKGLAHKKRRIYNTVRTSSGSIIDMKRKDVDRATKKAFDQAVIAGMLTTSSGAIPTEFQTASWVHVPSRLFSWSGAWNSIKSAVSFISPIFPGIGSLIGGKSGEAVGTAAKTLSDTLFSARSHLCQLEKRVDKNVNRSTMIPLMNPEDRNNISENMTNPLSIVEVENIAGNEGSYEGTGTIGERIDEQDLPLGSMIGADASVVSILPADQLVGSAWTEDKMIEPSALEADFVNAEIHDLTGGFSIMRALNAPMSLVGQWTEKFDALNLRDVTDMFSIGFAAHAGAGVQCKSYSFTADKKDLTEDYDSNQALGFLSVVPILGKNFNIATIVDLYVDMEFILETDQVASLVAPSIAISADKKKNLFMVSPTALPPSGNTATVTYRLPMQASDDYTVNPPTNNMRMAYLTAANTPTTTRIKGMRVFAKWNSTSPMGIFDAQGQCDRSLTFGEYLRGTWDDEIEPTAEFSLALQMPCTIWSLAASVDRKYKSFMRLIMEYLLHSTDGEYLLLIRQLIGAKPTDYTDMSVGRMFLECSSLLRCIVGLETGSVFYAKTGILKAIRLIYMSTACYAEMYARNPPAGFIKWMVQRNYMTTAKTTEFMTQLHNDILGGDNGLPIGPDPKPVNPSPGPVQPSTDMSDYAKLFVTKLQTQVGGRVKTVTTDGPSKSMTIVSKPPNMFLTKPLSYLSPKGNRF